MWLLVIVISFQKCGSITISANKTVIDFLVPLIMCYLYEKHFKFCLFKQNGTTCNQFLSRSKNSHWRNALTCVGVKAVRFLSTSCWRGEFDTFSGHHWPLLAVLNESLWRVFKSTSSMPKTMVLKFDSTLLATSIFCVHKRHSIII